MPIRFDLLAQAGALPPTQNEMHDLDLEDDGEYVVDRTISRNDANKNVPAALKVTANCYERFAPGCTGSFVVHAGRIAGVFGFCFGFTLDNSSFRITVFFFGICFAAWRGTFLTK